MSESLPPDDDGPDPYEGQDLEGLLSGEIGYVPEELLKVIPTLDALRAAPRGAGLFGEASARAEFRRLMLAGRGEPAFAEAGSGDARTLILPSAVAGGAGPHVVRRRPHSHRRPPKRGRWQAKALVGVAAAAIVAVGAAALASTLSHSGGRPAASAPNTGTASTAVVSAASRSHGVDGSGSPEPSAKPTHTSPAQSGSSPSPGQLCREYFDDLAQNGWHEKSLADSPLYQELSSLAKGRGGVNYYCMHRLDLWEMPQNSGNFPGPLSNGGPGQQGSEGSQGAQATAGPPENGANGNGQSKNGPGSSGNQNQS